MARYIDKDALVAEIESLENIYKEFPARNSYEDGLKDGRLIGYKDTLYKIDTLEVKEVDLDESARNYLLHEHVSPLNEVLHQADLKVEMQYHKDIEDAYKAGFELGLKTSIVI